MNPLNLQIKEHEKVLAKRIENFKKIRDNISSVEDRIKQLEKLRVALESQAKVLSGIKVSLDGEQLRAAKVERGTGARRKSLKPAPPAGA